MKMCAVESCDSKSRALNYCNAHYKKFKTYGDPMGGKPTMAERFWAKVQKGDSCWHWQASTYPNGYGQFNVGMTMRCAHRVAYQLSVGLIPEGLEIDHVCHNRICVNPAHLRPTTRKQNVENHAGAQRNSKSGIRGVTWSPTCGGRWTASVQHNGKNHFAGRYHDIKDAEAAVIAKRLELFTHNNVDRQAA